MAKSETLVGRIGGLLGLRAHIAKRQQTASERYAELVRALATDSEQVDPLELDRVAASLGVPLLAIERDVEHVDSRLKAAADIEHAAAMLAEEEVAIAEVKQLRKAKEDAQAAAKKLVDDADEACKAAKFKAERISNRRTNLEEQARKKLRLTGDPAIAARLAELQARLKEITDYRLPLIDIRPLDTKSIPHGHLAVAQRDHDERAAEVQSRNQAQIDDKQRKIDLIKAEINELTAQQSDPNSPWLPSMAPKS